MENAIVETPVRLIRAEKLAGEYEVLGTSILAHLLAIHRGGVVSERQRSLLNARTIRAYGLAYGANSRRMIGYRQAWIGKAFEYAVAELFNNRSEPFWSLVCRGIELAMAAVPSRAKLVRLEIPALACVRICKESSDREALLSELRRFRTVSDARLSLAGATGRYPTFEEKVDVLFCERDADGPRFAVTASLKISRQHFLTDGVQRDFKELPLDLGITAESARFREVKFEESLGVHIVYLPIDGIDSEIAAWRSATEIVEKALVEGDRNWLLGWMAGLFRRGSAANAWVEFLADRLDTEVDEVLADIRQKLGNPQERTGIFPVLLGKPGDAALDLCASLNAPG